MSSRKKENPRRFALKEKQDAHERSAERDTLSLSLPIIRQGREIVQLRGALAEKDKELLQLNEVASEKDRELQCLREVVAEKDDEIVRLPKAVASRDREILLRAGTAAEFLQKLRSRGNNFASTEVGTNDNQQTEVVASEFGETNSTSAGGTDWNEPETSPWGSSMLLDTGLFIPQEATTGEFHRSSEPKGRELRRSIDLVTRLQCASSGRGCDQHHSTSSVKGVTRLLSVSPVRYVSPVRDVTPVRAYTTAIGGRVQEQCASPIRASLPQHIPSPVLCQTQNGTRMQQRVASPARALVPQQIPFQNSHESSVRFQMQQRYVSPVRVCMPQQRPCQVAFPGPVTSSMFLLSTAVAMESAEPSSVSSYDCAPEVFEAPNHEAPSPYLLPHTPRGHAFRVDRN